MDFEITTCFDDFGPPTMPDALAMLPMHRLIDSGPVVDYLLDIDRAAAEIAEWAASEKGG